MDRRFYRTGQFAQRALVSERTLRYYDYIGLLSPSHYTEAGYRLYSDEDLLSLQYILALKFLGFSLEEIEACLRTGPGRLQEVLAQQKAMMEEKRQQLATIIKAIETTEQLLKTDHWHWDDLVKTIQVIQMEQNNDTVKSHLTEEQRQKVDALIKKSYTPDALQKLAQRGVWTEEDQKRVSQQYARLDAEIKRLTAAQADPGSPEAQAAAKLSQELLFSFTQGDPEVTAGLAKYGELVSELPSEEKPFGPRFTKEEEEFLHQAQAIYHQGADAGI